RMARDLDLVRPYADRIFGVATVREADGLAMSSRNRRLNAEQRTRSLALSRALRRAQALHAAGERTRDALERAMRDELEAAVDAFEYAVLVDPITLEPAAEPIRRARALIACRVGSVRLIDNAAVGEGALPLPGGGS
ncbi:MAG: pantoate--beta-alanine ligase, partial [Myxococcales bacterium]|nr:pantoate--beta-alanine ligase [Myxococcales bacterium]